jgi:uncharacterized membrane-anchored protein
MSRRAVIAFAAVVAAMVAVVLGTIAWNEWKLASGKTYRLQVQPVDPVDFFRGGYVRLTYPISRATLDDSPWERGDVFYVPLRRVNGHWTGESGFRENHGGDVIRGTYVGRFGAAPIEFGIETFYVEEGQARRYEQAMIERRLYADVVIDDDGKARLEDLVIRPQ